VISETVSFSNRTSGHSLQNSGAPTAALIGVQLAYSLRRAAVTRSYGSYSTLLSLVSDPTQPTWTTWLPPDRHRRAKRGVQALLPSVPRNTLNVSEARDKTSTIRQYNTSSPVLIPHLLSLFARVHHSRLKVSIVSQLHATWRHHLYHHLIGTDVR
jgi:hypothetical protein